MHAFLLAILSRAVGSTVAQTLIAAENCVSRLHREPSAAQSRGMQATPASEFKHLLPAKGLLLISITHLDFDVAITSTGCHSVRNSRIARQFANRNSNRHFMGNFWVRRGPEMIGSHRAPSSLNITPYRAIWTHFKQNSMSFTNSISSCWHLGQVHDRFTIDPQ